MMTAEIVKTLKKHRATVIADMPVHGPHTGGWMLNHLFALEFGHDRPVLRELARLMLVEEREAFRFASASGILTQWHDLPHDYARGYAMILKMLPERDRVNRWGFDYAKAVAVEMLWRGMLDKDSGAPEDVARENLKQWAFATTVETLTWEGAIRHFMHEQELLAA